MNPILIIAFKFPPYAGVGGFRCAKMAKYLALQGRDVHVVTVDWDVLGPDSLIEDVTHDAIHIHHIDSGLPHNDLLYRGNVPARIKRRDEAARIMDQAGIFDEAGLWGDHLLPYCEQLMRTESIRCVFVSGHPFHANLWAADLKKNVPETILIQDFRDLISSLKVNTPATAKDCLAMQARCVDSADAVTVISPGMASALEAETPSDKYVVLRNGFDPETLAPFAVRRKKYAPGEPLRLCYLGSLGGGRSEVMNTLLHAVRDVNSAGQAVRVILHGNNHEYISDMFGDLLGDGVISLNPSVDFAQAMTTAAGCDMGVNLLAPGMEHYLPTKIYDYMGLGLPCLSIGPDGDTSAILAHHDCGLTEQPDRNCLAHLLQRLTNELPTFTFAGVEERGADRVAERLGTLMDSIVEKRS